MLDLWSEVSNRFIYSIPEPVFHVNGAAIQNVKEWLHLGHMLTSDLTDHVEL